MSGQKIVQANIPKKQTYATILIFEKSDFKPNLLEKIGKVITYSLKEISTKRTLQFLTSMHQTQGHARS